MGLISKIEEKLSGSHSQDESKLQQEDANSGYTSGHGNRSSLDDHPQRSGITGGTAIPSLGSNQQSNTTNFGQDGRSGIVGNSSPTTTGYGKDSKSGISGATTSGLPGSYPSSNTRTNTTTTTTTSGYKNGQNNPSAISSSNQGSRLADYSRDRDNNTTGSGLSSTQGTGYGPQSTDYGRDNTNSGITGGATSGTLGRDTTGYGREREHDPNSGITGGTAVPILSSSAQGRDTNGYDKSRTPGTGAPDLGSAHGRYANNYGRNPGASGSTSETTGSALNDNRSDRDSTGYGREGNTTSGGLVDKVRDKVGLASSTDHNTSQQSYDPYSSKGQKVAANAADSRNDNAYGASQSRRETGDTGNRRNVDDSDVYRTPSGGVSNQMSPGSQGQKSGPLSRLENRDAVPTAGGQKIGESGEAYDSPSKGESHQSQHHYGRDAGLVAGAGALGAGAAAHHHHGHGHESERERRSYEQSDQRPSYDDSQSRYGTGSNNNNRSYEDSQSRYGTGNGYGNSSNNNDKYNTGSNYGNNNNRSSHDDSQSRSGTGYGNDNNSNSNISYMNRTSADQPLSQSRDFNDRHQGSSSDRHHGSSGTSALGAGALGVGAGALASHHNHNRADTTTRQGVTTGAPSGNSASPTARNFGNHYQAGYEAGYKDGLVDGRAGH